MLPADLFSPSVSHASAIDQAVRASLGESFAWCLDQAGIDSDPVVRALQARTARPTDFGGYYDLVVALTGADGAATAEVRDLAQRLADRIHRPGLENTSPTLDQGRPVLSTLREPWYDPDEVDCLIRWFDIEPENALGLSALDDRELAHESAKLRVALSAMRALMPQFLDEMLAITREIVLAKPSGQQLMTFGGASSFSLWGALALNVQAHPDWWLYLPRLVHEYSHNLLFGMAREEPLLLNDPTERYPSPLRQEMRPLDGIFHAAFVSAREAVAMREACLKLQVGGGSLGADGLEGYCRETQEQSIRSYQDCIAVLRQHGRMSGLGQEVLASVEAVMEPLVSTRQ